MLSSSAVLTLSTRQAAAIQIAASPCLCDVAGVSQVSTHCSLGARSLYLLCHVLKVFGAFALNMKTFGSDYANRSLSIFKCIFPPWETACSFSTIPL